MEKKFDLEERLIVFAVDIIHFSESLPSSIVGNHLGNQLLRSGTSPSLNYGEVKGSESKKDFIHKMKLCLKELRETYNCLRIISRAGLSTNNQRADKLIAECNELISIFVSSVNTASKSIKNS